MNKLTNMVTLESTQPKTGQKPASIRPYLLLALILPIFAVAPLFYPGYLQTHNGFVGVWNVADLRANWGDWTWLPHLINFDPLRSDGLFPYYLASLLPLQPGPALKLVLGLGWLLASLGMFLWLKDWLGHHGALVAALVYTYLPHQIATVYVRGAWGETFFWGLLPWGILVTTFLAKNLSIHLFRTASWPGRFYGLIYLLLAVLVWLLLGLSHLGLTIWAFLFVTCLLLVLFRGQALLPVLTALLGLGVALAFYLPLSPLSATAPLRFSDHFLYPFQLLSAYWGFGPSRPGWNDGLSLQLGLAAVGLTILSLVVWQRKQAPQPPISRTDRRLIFFLSAAIVSIFLQFSLTAFVWHVSILPGYALSSTLTYPWQLLGLTGLCLAVLAGSALWLDSRLRELPLFGAIILFIILSSYSYLAPQFIQADPYLDTGPQAQLGGGQLALVDHDFSVMTTGNTAGFAQAEITVPLTTYGPLQPDDVLLLNVTWQPLQPFNEDWKIFVHLVDARAKVLAQYDDHPRSGAYPTSQWIPGELIKDSYPLRLPADLPPGPYRVFLGLYDEVSLARLPVSTDPEGRVILNVE